MKPAPAPHSLRPGVDDVLVFGVLCLVFGVLFSRLNTDLDAHVLQAAKIATGEAAYPPNALYYLALNALTGFSGAVAPLYVAAVLVLAACTTFKYTLTKGLLRWLALRSGTEATTGRTRLIAAMALFSFTIPDPYFFGWLGHLYLGRFVPVVWHNSTTIALFPFALLLFWQQLKLFADDHPLTARRFGVLVALIVVNALIKPSFLFVFLPVSAGWVVVRVLRRDPGKACLNLVAFALGGAAVAAESLLIYRFQVGTFDRGEAGIGLSRPFEVFSAWVPAWYVPVSLLISFCLPLTALALRGTGLTRDRAFLYAGLLVVGGVFLSALVVETGERRFHGNFTWQTIPCSYLLLLATAAFFGFPRPGAPTTRGGRVLVGLFVGQFVAGLLYLVHMAWSGSYM